MVLAVRKTRRVPRGQPRIIKVRSHKYFQIQDFEYDLKRISWNAVVESDNNPTDAWNHVTTLLYPVRDKHAPIVHMKVISTTLKWLKTSICPY